MKSIFLFLLLFSSAFATQGQAPSEQASERARTAHFDLKHGVALQGYDPVAYFTQGTALRATGTIRHTYRGIQYFFRCDKHLNIFKTTPQAFEPQYGGWCAFAMSQSSQKVKADPQVFVIYEGQSYFFQNKAKRQQWLDNQRRKARADEHWLALIDNQ